MKKFVASLLSIIMITGFINNISLAKESQNLTNAIEIQKENNSNNESTSLREQQIKALKDLREKNNKLYLEKIKKFENMSDKKYNLLRFIKVAGKTILICVGILSVIGYGFIDFAYETSAYKDGYKAGYKEGKDKGYHEGFIKELKKYYGISVDCQNSESNSSLRSFLSKILNTFNPRKSSEIKKFDDIKEIYYDANNLYDELKNKL